MNLIYVKSCSFVPFLTMNIRPKSPERFPRRYLQGILKNGSHQSVNMEEKITFTGRSGEPIAAMLSRPHHPNGKGVVLLHCFLCTKHHRVVRSVSEALAVQGITTLRFDFYGNGESGGRMRRRPTRR